MNARKICERRTLRGDGRANVRIFVECSEAPALSELVKPPSFSNSIPLRWRRTKLKISQNWVCIRKPEKSEWMNENCFGTKPLISSISVHVLSNIEHRTVEKRCRSKNEGIQTTNQEWKCKVKRKCKFVSRFRRSPAFRSWQIRSCFWAGLQRGFIKIGHSGASQSIELPIKHVNCFTLTMISTDYLSRFLAPSAENLISTWNLIDRACKLSQVLGHSIMFVYWILDKF